jgi:DNA-binding CsgD family transcriptional regulator
VSGPIKTGRTPLVGRQQERDRLKERLAAAREGRGGVVLMAGEPGIGKTRLLLELADEARAQGWVVLAGCAYESEGAPPFLPFSQALRGYVRVCPPQQLRSVIGPDNLGAMLLVPEVRELLPDLPAAFPLPAEYERHRLFESICDCLLRIGRATALADGTGLLLVLDDLQWADRPTLLLLAHLALRVVTPSELFGPYASILVAGAYRSPEVGRNHPLTDVLAHLTRAWQPVPLELARLQVSEVATLVDSLLEAPAAPAVAEAICQRTEGNPFFVGQIVRHLQAEHRDLADPRTAAGDWGVPAGVRQVIGTRLARLSADANAVLEAGAVFGDGFSFEVAGAMSGIDEPALMDALEEALQASMIREEGEAYYFTHALIRQTLYDDLSLPRRQRLHLQSGMAIERLHRRNLDRHAESLAMHYRLAGPAADAEKALEYTLRAGELALAVFAWEAAAGHWSAALGLMERHGVEPARRAELLDRLGELMVTTGLDHAGGIAHLQSALALSEQAGAGERAAETHCRLGRALSTFPPTRDIPRALAHFRAAEGVLGGGPARPAQVDLYVGLGVAAHWALRMDEALAASGRALEIAERLGNECVWANAALRRGIILIESGAHADGFALLERAWETADRFDIVFVALEAAWHRTLLTWLGDGRAAQAWYQRELAKPRLAQAPDHRRILLGVLSWAHTMAGELSEARSMLDELGPGTDWFTAWPESQLAFRSGDWERAASLLTEERDKARRSGDRLIEWVAGYWLGRVSQARGEVSAAEALWAEGLAIADGQLTYAEVWNRSSLALLYAETNRLGEARPHLARCRDILDAGEDWRGLAGRVVLAEGAMAAAEGRVAEAAGRFAEAVAIFRCYTLPWDEAEALHAWGRALVAAGRRTAGREQLGAAREIYRRRDAGERWLARVGPTGPPPPSFPDRLTAREVEVLQLLAAGSTNKEIAARLFLSARTVERHIASIFDKIGARRRVDATAYALRHGLLPL